MTGDAAGGVHVRTVSQVWRKVQSYGAVSCGGGYPDAPYTRPMSLIAYVLSLLLTAVAVLGFLLYYVSVMRGA